VARVALPLPIESAFDYAVPPDLAVDLAPGCRVRVRFGARRLVGVVIEVDPADAARPAARLRPLESRLDATPVLPTEILSLARFAADHYLAGIGEVLAGASPPPGRVRAASAPAGVGPAGARLRLSTPQQAAVDAIGAQLRAEAYRPFLLHGVTGSGKTEVYLRAAEETLARGRGVLYLVPEIGLTSLLAGRARERLGETVVLLHSALPRAVRRRSWERLAGGDARVALGARSAVFAPLPDLGLVIVDEEHDGSYKQDERPRYHARDLALVRAQRAGAVVVLGSATPAIESYARAREGRYHLLDLPGRVGDRPLATAEIVDMRAEFGRDGGASPLSARLRERLAETLGRREQAILLLNRRGYSAFLLCRTCGEIPGCPRCSVALSVHRAGGKIRCHTCGYWRGIPTACARCGGDRLDAGGEGTERLEAAVAATFPGARVGRLDRDSARRAGAATSLLQAFERGELDVLVGTQMVAKGHDFPHVTLVGVLQAEAALALPDFRASERTFALLTQVAGRAGRGAADSSAVIQTFTPDHYAIRHAAAQDYAAFYAEEIRYRRLLQYPPFTYLAVLIVGRPSEAAAQRHAEALARELMSAGGGFLRVLGPAPAPLARRRGEHRVQILVKARARGRLHDAIHGAMAALDVRGLPRRHVAVDVDPVSLR
jgi:primosomal protein N' (replication factor Y)